MDLTVAREWLVRQHTVLQHRPWKIAIGIVTPRTHASKRGGALGAQLRAREISAAPVSTTLLAMGVALQKHTKQPHMCTPHPKCGTKHTSHPPLHGPTPHVVHQWPPPSYPLAGEEGTGDGCVLQQLIHPGQDAGVVDGEAHPRVHDEFNELLNIMVGLLVPNKEDPRQGVGVGADPSPSLHGWWVACICRRVGQEGG